MQAGREIGTKLGEGKAPPVNNTSANSEHEMRSFARRLPTIIPVRRLQKLELRQALLWFLKIGLLTVCLSFLVLEGGQA